MSSDRIEQIQQLFLAATEIESGDRSDWLRDHCEDEQIRQEVASLLQHHDRPQDPLEEGVAVDTVHDRSSLLGTSKPKLPGYEIVNLLGAGGQCVVFEAIQQSTTQRVAVKMLRWGSASTANERDRFEREVKILSQLNHPNILSIIDRGQTSDGAIFLVTEFVDGLPIDQASSNDIRERDAPDGTDVIGLFLKVADAVDFAHRAGVIHRDLKPSNVLVDQHHQPKVLDFGLAKPAFGANIHTDDAREITLTGHFLGSLPWASPEQAKGEEIDARSDVYSLGVMLYQLVTGGRFPYRVAGSIRDVLDEIINAAPTPPSKVAADLPSDQSAERSLGGGIVNQDIEAIVMKALAKSPDQRYQSAGELGDDLKQYLAGKPIAPTRGDEQRTAKSRIWSVPIAMVAVLAAIAAVPIASRLFRPEDSDFATAVHRDAGNHPDSKPGSIESNVADLAEQPAESDADRNAPGDQRLRDQAKAALGPGSAVEAALPSPFTDAEAAKWLLSQGGTVELIAGDTSHTVKPTDTLPNGEIVLTGIVMQGAPWADQDLSPMRSLKDIRKLDFRGSRRLSGEFLKYFAASKQLESLDVAYSGCSDKIADPLIGFRKLKYLDLSGARISETTLEALSHLADLTLLSLELTKVSDQDLRHLSALTNLETLGLNRTTVSDACLQHVDRLPKLQVLAFLGANITDTGAAKLATFMQLRRLVLSGTEISDDGVASLARLDKLKELNLSGTEVSDLAAGHIATMKTLSGLNLSSTKVTDEGIMSLTTIPRLIGLTLSNTAISDECVPALSKHVYLRRLAIADTRITDEGFRRLKAALPGTGISR